MDLTKNKEILEKVLPEKRFTLSIGELQCANLRREITELEKNTYLAMIDFSGKHTVEVEVPVFIVSKWKRLGVIDGVSKKIFEHRGKICIYTESTKPKSTFRLGEDIFFSKIEAYNRALILARSSIENYKKRISDEQEYPMRVEKLKKTLSRIETKEKDFKTVYEILTKDH